MGARSIYFHPPAPRSLRSDARQAKLQVNQQWSKYHETSLNFSDLRLNGDGSLTSHSQYYLIYYLHLYVTCCKMLERKKTFYLGAWTLTGTWPRACHKLLFGLNIKHRYKKIQIHL